MPDPSHPLVALAGDAGSQGLLQQLVETVADYAMVLLDPSGRIQTWNHGAQRLTGYTGEEIIGRHVSVLCLPEDVSAGKPQRGLEEAQAKGRIEDEGWRLRKDGTRFWANVVLTALYGEDGTLRGFGSITRDLTERKKAEEALRRSEESFRLMVESVRDYAIFMIDTAGIVRTWNRGAQQIKGYRRDEIVGRHFSVFYLPEAVAAGKPQQSMLAAIEQGSFEDEDWRVRQDGTRFWANVVLTALYDEDGELYGFAKVTRDLTERKSAAAAQIHNEALKEAVRVRDEFLSVASHELRTPLTSLQLQVESLLRHLGSQRPPGLDGLRHKVAVMARQTERLGRLVNDMLDVVRVEGGKMTLNLGEADLAGIVRDVVTRHAEDLQRAGCTLQLAASTPVLGCWDPSRLDQVVTNLVTNAIKYGAQRPIEIEVGQEGDLACLTVRDHGIGMPPEDLARVFERFVRLSSSRHYGGLGLGLWINREFVTAMGGTIAVDSVPGQGATFQVRLPIQPCEPSLPA